MNYRTRKLLSSRLRRALRWEFWPLWAFYPPIIAWICLLGIRHRNLLLFTAANPGMDAGGLIDLNKFANLDAIQKQYPGFTARTFRVTRLSDCQKVMEENKHILAYPVILKPNAGQRGIAVEIVRNHEQLDNYFCRHKNQAILLQEYVDGLEFGVFYMREPDQPQGRIFSINQKLFPEAVGNGVDTLEKLILNDPRQHYMAEYLLNLHAERLQEIPAANQSIKLVEIGSHCRGSVFIEASGHITQALQQRIDSISKAIPGYHFGRYDLRVTSIEDLRQGKNLKILEANGVSSESANIYDPSCSLIDAYKVMFKQWQSAFRIGAKNRAQGHSPASLKHVFNNWSRINRE